MDDVQDNSSVFLSRECSEFVPSAFFFSYVVSLPHLSVYMLDVDVSRGHLEGTLHKFFFYMFAPRFLQRYNTLLLVVIFIARRPQRSLALVDPGVVVEYLYSIMCDVTPLCLVDCDFR